MGLTLSTSDTHQFRPVRSSGLAVEDTDDGFVDGRKKEERSYSSSGGMKGLFSIASSVSSLSEDEEVEEPSKLLRIQTASSRSSSSLNDVHAVLKILDDEAMDDESRIEKAREMIALALLEVEGVPVVSMPIFREY